MIMKLLTITSLSLLMVLGLFGCAKDEPPSRDEIPVLQNKLYALEQGILSRNRAALDSMLSVEILDNDQSSDSLLSYVYGPEGNYPFTRLGKYEIMYNNDYAFIDCYVMDSAETTSRPIKFTFKNDDGIWLLKKFEPGKPDTSSTEW